MKSKTKNITSPGKSIASPGYKYYYTLLDDSEKQCYNIVLNALLQHQEKITTPKFYPNHLGRIFSYVIYDNPIIFYFDNYSYAEYYIEDKTEISLSYTMDKSQALTVYKQICEKIENEIPLAGKNLSDYQKVLYVHKYLVSNISYDYTFNNDTSYNILGPVINHSGVCEGISKYSKMIFDLLGINCIVVNGTLDEKGNKVPHCWNILEVDNRFSHFDFTSDICLSDKNERYDYVGLNDGSIRRDHTMMGKYPMCVANEYYVGTGKSLKTKKDVSSAIAHALKNGEKTIVFKIDSNISAANLLPQLDKIIESSASNFRFSNYIVSYNETQNVFQIDFH